MNTRRKKRGGFGVVILILLILALIAVLGLMVFRHYYGLLDIKDADELTGDGAVTIDSETHRNAKSQTGVYNLLLLGVDAREDVYNTRTDTMMLVSVNRSTKKIVLSSFLRDTYISIPGFSWQRLNAANALGGPGKTIETIEANYGVAIDNYAFVNFFSFIKVVDAMGGVDLSLTDDEVFYVNKWVNDYELQVDDASRTPLESRADGQYHLNGMQSLAFCRSRDIGYDMGRTSHQRRMIEALWIKARDLDLVELSDLMGTVLPEITTDISGAACLLQLASVPAYRDYELVSLQVPADGTYTPISVDGASMLDPDLEANKALLMESIFDK